MRQRTVTLAGLVLLALTAVRLLVAAAAPLSPDEAYYWVWSRALAAGYLDHPPMVALWIRLGTGIAGETALGVRLMGPLAAALGSFLLASATDRLFPGRGNPGLVAATLLNATLMLGAGAVTMTPDTPLLFFTTAAIWALSRVEREPRWWLLVGLVAGLAMDSKYTAVLWAVGVPIWLVWVPSLRPHLRQPWPWLGGAIAIVSFLPVVVWNAGHHWASIIKQGGRTGDWDPGAALQHVGELLASQFALATPLVFVLFAAGLGAAIRGAARRDPSWTLLAALTAPGLVIFLQHAVGDRVQPNWVAVIYPSLAVAAVASGARFWRAAACLGFLLTGLVYLEATAAPLPLPRRFDPTLVRLAGWDKLAQEADALRREAGAAYLASEDYGQASLLAWWAPSQTEVVGAEARWILFGLPAPAGRTGLLLVSERRREGPDPALWGEATVVGHIARSRAGVEAEAFRVYRVVLREGATAARLPRRGGE
ncbi:MAG: glycosyltransferase family 39 protein [Acetobacteraceae bacterium]|nr:glycosyltransferase family 39 protein [Acetobacteraceae bacterium]